MQIFYADVVLQTLLDSFLLFADARSVKPEHRISLQLDLVAWQPLMHSQGIFLGNEDVNIMFYAMEEANKLAESGAPVHKVESLLRDRIGTAPYVRGSDETRRAASLLAKFTFTHKYHHPTRPDGSITVLARAHFSYQQVWQSHT